jgi:post-segregation antitoxin (ccd killing protein)
MPANTTMITSTKTLTTPTALTIAAAKAAGIDYSGMMSAALSALAQSQCSLKALAAATHAADPNLATINNMLLTLS